MSRGRFAPSTTGSAHPGTLLAALLCWLDARSRGGAVELRLEDLDPQRSHPERVATMRADLQWLGLEWDRTTLQSENAPAHESALEELASSGRLYPCACTRRELRKIADALPDGSRRYPNRCRMRSLPSTARGGWRAATEPLRARLPDARIELRDESGLDLSMNPARELGDPIVRRRDGSVAYQLASLVDDQSSGVDRVVRGRDLAPSTGLQVALGRLLGYETPTFRHHFLLLEERGGKLAKLHGAVGAKELRAHYSPRELCGWLAFAADLQESPEPTAPALLVERFSWSRVRSEDRVVRWDGSRLSLPEGRSD